MPRSHFSDTMMEMTSRTRSWPLYVAALWALVCLVVAFTYHINQPIGVLSVTISGHTYTGFPPALTLFESDGASVLVIAGVVAGALLMAVIDHLVRQRRNYGGPGIASAIVGVCWWRFRCSVSCGVWRPSASWGSTYHRFTGAGGEGHGPRSMRGTGLTHRGRTI